MKLQALLTVLMMFVPIMADTHDKAVGVTPDSVLWGIDVALDKISLALTTNPEKRAEKALVIAQERLLEVKAMAENGKIEAAAKAESEHESTIKKVEESLDRLQVKDPEEQIQKELEIETKLKAHKESVDEIKASLKVKIQVEGELSIEQQEKLDAFLASLSEDTEKAQVKIQSKKEDTKIRIREKTGESEDEVEQRVGTLELEHGLFEGKFEVRGQTIGNQTFVKIELEYDTNLTETSAVLSELVDKLHLDAEKADALLELRSGDEEDENPKELFKVKVETDDEGSEVDARLRFVINSTLREQIIDVISQKTSFELSEVEAATKVKETKAKEKEHEDEVEIQVEVRSDGARVKIKVGDEKTRLELNTTNQTEILAAIASQLGLSVEEIKKFTEFENEDESSEDDHAMMEESEENENSTEDTAEDSKKMELEENKTGDHMEEESDDKNRTAMEESDKDADKSGEDTAMGGSSDKSKSGEDTPKEDSSDDNESDSDSTSESNSNSSSGN